MEVNGRGLSPAVGLSTVVVDDGDDDDDYEDG